MQKITREQLIEKASELLSNGTVSAVLGWGAGEFGYDVTPTTFKTVEELKNGFVFSDFCGANFSKYLVAKTQKTEGKILVFLKPCDTYSFNQLLTEHRFDREKVYAVGIPCEGMADISKIKQSAAKVFPPSPQTAISSLLKPSTTKPLRSMRQPFLLNVA